MTLRLEATLGAVREAGGKAFVPYATAGLPGVDGAFLRALQDVGADAVEVGIPFSDPVMDGPVIQEASRRALERGTLVADAFRLVRQAALTVPVVLMTYLNPVLAYGEERFAAEAASCEVAGAIVPDLPVDEAGRWMDVCRGAGVAPVLLAAPNSTEERLDAIAAVAGGFVYCVSALGVTGERDRLAASAGSLVGRLRSRTTVPLLVGVGVSTPEHARQVCSFADGAIVGTAIVRPLLDGSPAEALREAERFAAAVHG